MTTINFWSQVMTIGPTCYISAWMNDNFKFLPGERYYVPRSAYTEFRSIHRLIAENPEQTITFMTHVIPSLLLKKDHFPDVLDPSIELLKILTRSNLDQTIINEVKSRFKLFNLGGNPNGH